MTQIHHTHTHTKQKTIDCIHGNIYKYNFSPLNIQIIYFFMNIRLYAIKNNNNKKSSKNTCCIVLYISDD